MSRIAPIYKTDATAIRFPNIRDLLSNFLMMPSKISATNDPMKNANGK